MRRACGLLLAIGLVPAASGGALCLAHWTDDFATSETAQTNGPHDHAAHSHAAHAHAHHAPDAPAPDAPAHDDAAPCTALAACGVAAAPEAPRALAAPPLPHTAVHIAAHTLPRGPAYTPDVPPPRR
jgi:hypothetical protein